MGCESWGPADSDRVRFCRWLRNYCGMYNMDGVQLGEFWHNGLQLRGLEATRDIPEGEEVLCLPSKCWMREEAAPADLVAKLSENCTEDAITAIFIAEELRFGEASAWAPYFPLLPTREDYESFHPAYLEGKYATNLNSNTSYWSHWMEPVGQCFRHYQEQGGTLDAELLFYAYVLLVSRRFDDVSIPPLLDMANTDVEDKVNVYGDFNVDVDDKDGDEDKDRDVENLSFCYYATKDIPKGSELLADYGSASKSAMLSFSIYGFALEPSAHNASLHYIEDVEEVDQCSNLYSENWHEIPDQEKDPIWHGYYTFAKRHCFQSLHEL